MICCQRIYNMLAAYYKFIVKSSKKPQYTYRKDINECGEMSGENDRQTKLIYRFFSSFLPECTCAHPCGKND